MSDGDPFTTQRDVGREVVSELDAAGLVDAIEIGRGGFGVVYKCTQVGLDRMVAVKVLTSEREENRQRFLREQRAMGRLTGHPHIVGVMQVGQLESGFPYLVMQYHRNGSLEARIRRIGHLPLDEVLYLGVKMAGALETAHRLGIQHRDIKPGNILYTQYGEPALSDFGIAHIAGGFKTATGTFTGSPAFTAPEILSGDPPSQASDVYGLGSTLFAALTGHAAFERRSGEQVVAQFLRIATESAPDLRDDGIPEDIAGVIETAMTRQPQHRPSALALAEQLRKMQSTHGFTVDDIVLRTYGKKQAQPERQAPAPIVSRRDRGRLPLELNSFVGRRVELAEVARLFATSRLVTLTGIGGVGKTRLALHAAAELASDFPDGVRLVELGETREGSMLVDVAATALGVGEEAARPSLEGLVDFLFSRKLLLVIDNCEQVIDAAAKLVESLLRACPQINILATSRERLGVAGETLVPISSLAADAIELFVNRATAALPTFRLTSENEATVTHICARLDGLPLAIELAAARLRTMSLEQLLARLHDRYALLTHGDRAAPERQRTLLWSVGWSYDLCTPAEQQLWGRLSVFAGGFELEAAEHICAIDVGSEQLDDLLTSLVDKSIVNRTERDGLIRFRLIDTLRDYGRDKLHEIGEDVELRRRHLDWFRRLAHSAGAEWFGPRQLEWMKRLDSDVHNFREALGFALSVAPEVALEMVASLHWYGDARGVLNENRHWLDCALAATSSKPTADRIKALHAAAVIAGGQGDLAVATERAAEARLLSEQTTDPVARGLAAVADGFTALLADEFGRASVCFDAALAASDEPVVRLSGLMLQGWVLQFRGDVGAALVWQEKALALAESAGEMIFRSYLLWSIGVGWWRHGNAGRAAELLRQCLELTHIIDDPRNGAACLEALAWIASASDQPRRAAVLMGAADELGRSVGVSTSVLPDLVVYHEDCERRSREALGTDKYEQAQLEGRSLHFDDIVAHVLDLQPGD